MQATFGSLSTTRDYEETVGFFKDKDTSKYRMALQQALDGIEASAAEAEVRFWLARHCRCRS